ncbi:MAG: hypothetical protein JJU08_14385 [Rhodobacteraceae bacterium]|nr:hypothetical protein [Paracoccaceae bacterium]
MSYTLRHLKSGTHQIRPYFTVPTNMICFKCGGVPKPERKIGKLFRPGDWDLRKSPVSKVQKSDPRYLFYKEYFFENVSIKDTTAYHYHRERQSRGNPRLGFETKERLLAQLQGYVRIFRDIEKDGKVTPGYQLMGRRGNEIGCIMGRDGNIMKLAGGNNRFAIASVLQLPTVPIQIYFMHMDLLDEVVATPGIFPGQKVNRFLLDTINVKG